MKQTERDLRGLICVIVCVLVLLGLIALDGCASRPKDASPDYANYLATMDMSAPSTTTTTTTTTGAAQ